MPYYASKAFKHLRRKVEAFSHKVDLVRRKRDKKAFREFIKMEAEHFGEPR